MKKEKYFRFTKFSPEVLAAGRDALATASALTPPISLTVSRGDQTWHFDDECECFSEYRQSDVSQAQYWRKTENGTELRVFYLCPTTHVTVDSSSREDINRVFEVFDSSAAACKLAIEEREAKLREALTIFIGHGGSPLWRDLKDHLHEKHGYKVVAYETGARAGFTIVQVLERLAGQAGFALLLMTGEDAAKDGSLHARENVIHECGLLQGKLGFSRAIVLLEDECQEFTNISGLQNIRFAKGNVKEAFGEVLATIRREFEA